MKNKALITTAIDYTNDVIHIGHAYEKILADSYARYLRIILGEKNVGFITGTDEHGINNERAAEKKGKTTKEFVDEISSLDKKEIDSMNVSYNRFIRTTDEDHKQIASDFFKKSFDNGDIYKSKYEGLYCEGCESYKMLNELNEEGQCPFHVTRKIQKYEEENYFFAWSKYTDFLRKLVSSENFVLPEVRRNEMLAFINNGLQDIPITRPKYKLNWGITVPIDESQVIYVWFDALINYFTFGSQNNLWDNDTEIIHFAGKDIARWHVLLWPAMLKSAGYTVPSKVYIHGFMNLEGKKISKSLGNVIRPTELVNKYGADAMRYYYLKYGPIIEDVDISIKHMEDVYNGELANGLGNTVARIAKLAEKSGFDFGKDETVTETAELNPMKNFRTDQALQNIWKRLTSLDKHINENEPWKITDQKNLKEVLSYEVLEIRKISKLLKPFIPETQQKIDAIFSNGKINSGTILFPRI